MDTDQLRAVGNQPTLQREIKKKEERNRSVKEGEQEEEPRRRK